MPPPLRNQTTLVDTVYDGDSAEEPQIITSYNHFPLNRSTALCLLGLSGDGRRATVADCRLAGPLTPDLTVIVEVVVPCDLSG